MSETNGEAIVRMMRDSLPKALSCGGVDFETVRELMCDSRGYCPAVEGNGAADDDCTGCVCRWLDEPFSGDFCLRYEPDGLFGPFARFEPVGREVSEDG